ncbi:MAG: hypothetical protein AAF581_11125 [Planctomycetota bacterium]
MAPDLSQYMSQFIAGRCIGGPLDGGWLYALSSPHVCRLGGSTAYLYRYDGRDWRHSGWVEDVPEIDGSGYARSGE